MSIQLRGMGPQDAEPVAGLHTESWRSTYRGILRDAYLDGPLRDEHRALWLARMARPAADAVGLVAHDGDALVGFAFALDRHHETWGAFLENLHVRPGGRGRGIGTRLLRGLSDRLLRDSKDAGLYLWAFEGNVRTRRYYERLGGVAVERAESHAPGGGVVPEWLYRWRSVAQLRESVAD